MNIQYLVLIKNFFFVQKEAGIPKKIIKVEDIPGLSKFFDNPQMFDLRIFNIVLMKCDYI